jgi:hypothetical protein
MRSMASWTSMLALVVLAGFGGTATAQEHTNKGPKVCSECHEAEVKVWSKSKHGKSYKTFHKDKKVKALALAVGDNKRAKKNSVCSACHYTMVTKKAGKKARARASTSCESCHGSSSKWIDIHNDFGEHKAETEPAAHKSERLTNSRKAGMIYSKMYFEIAENCMSCHGLANADVDAGDLAKLLANDHPVAKDYELVKYALGSVRHRFYGPDVSINKPMNKLEAARFFVTGQAAKLVSATMAAARSDDAAYKALQQGRVAQAKKALSAVKKSVPEAAALMSNPTRAAAKKLVAAIAGKDLTGNVGSMLPAASEYK